ncbi:hypothetical protein [Streptomyces sp. NPDC051577]|uniref:hypothetical protein n=1 Tax=Streptomyces sp. NPDC051577 TaxID=3155166 RepID=UPI00341770C1
MIVKFLHDKGLRSEHANTIVCLTTGLSVTSWVTSMKVEPAGVNQRRAWHGRSGALTAD